LLSLENSSTNNNLALQSTGQTAIGAAHILVIIYFAGIVFFFLKNLYSFVRMVFLMKNSRVERIDKRIRLVVHRRPIAPFSCLHFIVISEIDLQENGREIICHEKAHIQKLHAIDLFLSEMCILLQWFNPAAWLIRQEIKTVHEYQADNAVLDSGIDAKSYQLLLIKKAVGTIRFNLMTNSFNHSKLKKRITMMLKEKSSSWVYLKYALAIPIVAIALTAFAQPEIREDLNKISRVKITDLSEIQKIITKNSTVIKVDGKNSSVEVYRDGVQMDSADFTVISVGTDPTKLSNITVLQITKDGQIIDEEGNLVKNIQTYSYANADIHVKSLTNFNMDNVKVALIDGELKPIEEYHKLKPGMIKSVGLSVGDFSEQYGEDAKESILRISTK
jgi:hypothetical protein